MFQLKEDILHYEVFNLAGGRKRVKPGVVPRFNLGGIATQDLNATASTSTSNEVLIPRLLSSDTLLSQVQSFKQEKLDDETEAVASENYDYEMLYSEKCNEESVEDDEHSALFEIVEEKPHFEEIFMPELYEVVDDAIISSDLNKCTQTDDSFRDLPRVTSRAVQCETRNVATQTCLEKNSVGVSAEFDDINKIFK